MTHQLRSSQSRSPQLSSGTAHHTQTRDSGLAPSAPGGGVMWSAQGRHMTSGCPIRVSIRTSRADRKAMAVRGGEHGAPPPSCHRRGAWRRQPWIRGPEGPARRSWARGADAAVSQPVGGRGPVVAASSALCSRALLRLVAWLEGGQLSLESGTARGRRVRVSAGPPLCPRPTAAACDGAAPGQSWGAGGRTTRRRRRWIRSARRVTRPFKREQTGKAQAAHAGNSSHHPQDGHPWITCQAGAGGRCPWELVSCARSAAWIRSSVTRPWQRLCPGLRFLGK
nr:uncharacterized protein LOC123288154 isoform X2 [Equus asinus]